MKGPLLVALALLLSGCAGVDAPDAADSEGTGGSGSAEGTDGADGPGGSTSGSSGSGGTIEGSGSGSGSGSSGGSTGSDPFANVTAVSGNATGNGTDGDAPDWGDPDAKGIRPGINMEFDGAGCTTSFVFHQDWTRYFLATAAHCVADGANSDTDGCTAPLSDKTKATLRKDTGGTTTATVAYVSWAAMQRDGEGSADACAGNDFALLEIDADDLDDLHPASLHFEAPTGLATEATATVYGYGASTLKGGVQEVSPKEGRHITLENGGWSHLVYLVSPGVPGDSGGHIMTSSGEALGVASTIILSPTPGANHYTDLAKALAYMEAHEGWAPELVTWDGWDPSLV